MYIDAEEISKYFAVNTLGEGGFRSEKGKIKINDNTPVIIIGLGGTGGEALVRVKSELHNRFVTHGASLPPNVALLYIDTDGIDARSFGGIHEHVRGATYPLEDEEIYTLTGGAVISNFVQNRDLLDEHQREWLASELSPLATGDGAGGMRQYGRLLLFREIDNVISRIKSRFEAAYEGLGKYNHNAQVILISGISGGTGSGILLDMMFILKEIMNQEGYVGAHTSAYLFAPDVNADHVPDESTKEHMYKNGFATIKELDYWLNMDKNGAVFTQKYSDSFVVDSRTWPITKNPVDYCYFVSGKTIDGTKPSNPYDYAIRVVAESIIQSLSSAGDFSALAFLGHLHPMMHARQSSGVKFPVYRPYIAVGATQRSLNKDALINCILAFIWHKINTETFSRTPSEQDISRLFNYNAETIATTARSETNLTESDVKNEVPYSMFKKSVDPLDICENKVAFAKAHLWNFIINTTLEQSFALISNSVRDAFCDINRGPFYAHRLLLNVENPNGVIYKIERLIQQVMEKHDQCVDKLEDSENSYDLERSMREARDAAREFNFFTAGGDYNRYVKALINYYNAYRDKELYGMLYEKLIEFRNKVIDLNNEVVDLLLKLLMRLDNVFRDNAVIQTSMTEMNRHNNTVFTWDTVDYGSINQRVISYMNTMSAEKQEAFAQKLLEALYALASDKAFMTNHNPEDLNDKLVNVTEEYFNELLSISLQQQLAEELGVEFDPDADLQANPNANSEFVNAVERFVDTLISQSKPLFPIHSAANFYGIDNEFIKIYQVTCPQNAKYIKEGLLKAKTKYSELDIIDSTDQTKIFFQTMYAGVPAYAYADIVNCATVYDRFKPVQGLYKSGAHLRMSAKEDWSQLPCPIPKGAWEKYAYSSEDDASRIQKTTELMNEVWDKGLFCVSKSWNIPKVYIRTNVTEAESAEYGKNAWTGEGNAWGLNTLDDAIYAINSAPNYPIQLYRLPLMNVPATFYDAQSNVERQFSLDSSKEDLKNAGVTELQLLKEVSIMCAQQLAILGLNEILSNTLKTYNAAFTITMFINAYCCDFIKNQLGFWIFVNEDLLLKLFSIGATSSDPNGGDYKLVYGQVIEKHNLFCELANAIEYQLNKPENSKAREYFKAYFNNIEELTTKGDPKAVAFINDTYIVRLDRLIEYVTAFIRSLEEKVLSSPSETDIQMEARCIERLNLILAKATEIRKFYANILKYDSDGNNAADADDLNPMF